MAKTRTLVLNRRLPCVVVRARRLPTDSSPSGNHTPHLCVRAPGRPPEPERERLVLPDHTDIRELINLVVPDLGLAVFFLRVEVEAEEGGSVILTGLIQVHRGPELEFVAHIPRPVLLSAPSVWRPPEAFAHDARPSRPT